MGIRHGAQGQVVSYDPSVFKSLRWKAGVIPSSRFWANLGELMLLVIHDVGAFGSLERSWQGPIRQRPVLVNVQLTFPCMPGTQMGPLVLIESSALFWGVDLQK